MNHDSLLYHYQGIRSRFLEAEAQLDDVLSEAVSAGSAESLASRLDRARILAVAAYEDYTLIRKRLIAALTTTAPAIG